MSQRWVEQAPVGLATTGSGGGAARRLKARLARENWEVIPGFKFRPGFIYTQVRAISARINQNYDGWPADELKKSYHTFIGKPVFVNHENYDPKKARGVVVASRYVENGIDKYIDVIQEIDAQRYPKLAHEIKTGGMDSVSMGAEAAWTICSFCKHKATDESDMCDHVRYHKGDKLARFNRRTGKTDSVLVYESCHKLSFFELSYVFEPADETAVASKVLIAGKKQAGYGNFDTEHGADPTCEGCENNAWDSAMENAHDYATDALGLRGDEAVQYADENWKKHREDPHNWLPCSMHDPESASWVQQNPDKVSPDLLRHHTASLRKEAPFAGYKDFAACVAANQDKSDPSAYCGSIKHKVEDKKASFEQRVAAAMLNDCPPGQTCDKAPGLDLEQMPKSTVTTPPTDLSEGIATGTPASPTDPTAGGGGGTPVGGSGGVPLIKNPDGSYTSSDPAWAALINRESGGQNIIQAPTTKDVNSGGNEAFGIFQITPGTWTAHGGEGSVYDSTPEQQAAVAAEIFRSNPSGSDWGAGLAGREDPAALARGLSSSSQDIKASFERQVLRMAGYKTAEWARSERGWEHPDGGSVRPSEDAEGHYQLYGPTVGFRGPSGEAKLKRPHPDPKALMDWYDWSSGEGPKPPGVGFFGSRTAGATEDYETWKARIESGEAEPERGPKQSLPNKGLHDWAQRSRRRDASFEETVLHTAGYRLAADDKDKDDDDDRKTKAAPPSNDPNAPNAPGKSEPNPGVPATPKAGEKGTVTPNAPAPPGAPPAATGRAALEDWQLPGGTNPTDKSGPGGKGLAMPLAESQVGQWSPTLNHNVTTEDVSGKANQGTIDAWNKANPTNVFDPDMKYDPSTMEKGVQNIFTKPGPEGAGAPPPPAADVPAAPPGPTTPGEANDVMNQVGVGTPATPPATPSLPTPTPPPGPEALTPPTPSAPAPITSSFERKVLRLAYGETEAPFPVDTLREEGSAPEDDNDDFHHYVEPPEGLRDPDLSQAGQLDREGPGGPEQGVGAPGANPEDNMGDPTPYMVLKIPMPGQAPPGPMQPPPGPGGQLPPQIPPPPQGQPPQIPMQSFSSVIVPRTVVAYFNRYFDADVAGTTLENGRGVSQTSRKPRKGQTMGRKTSTLAQRGKVASRGKRQHFAEGPGFDGAPYGRNDEGEQEEVFLTQVPPAEPVVAPTDDTPNISNTKENLVAKVQQGRAQLLRDAQALAAYQADKGTRRQAGDDQGSLVNPSVPDSASEALTGDHFEALGEEPVRTDPREAAVQAENSLRAFQAFDQWLHQATGKQARHHTARNIRLAADEWAKRANADVRVLFPALGIVLRQARKIEAAQSKGAKMRKRSVDLEVAAPDGRVDVEAPVANVTDAEAQESQPDLSDFADNASDNLADPDLSTDSQFWAPGDGNKKSSKQPTRKPQPAGGILAVRAAEAYINAGLEHPESKYQLAGLFENMNKGTVQRDIALLERVSAVQAKQRQKVASGRTRGAASPVPHGLTQGGTLRAASVQRTAANDPINDALLFD